MRALVLAIGLLATSSPAKEPACPLSDVRQVPAGTFGSKTWNALYRSFRRYRGCDHGGEFSSSYTEDVARLLIQDWNTLPQAAPLFARNRSFLHFVVKHVDGTIMPEDLAVIEANARTRCPATMIAVCDRLAESVRVALEEQAEAKASALRHQQR